MARTTSANYTTPSFPKASAGTDPFLKEDIQALAAAMDGHDHSTGKGLAVAGATIPDGSITSAKIADGTIQAIDMAAGVAATNVGTLGGALTGTLPNPGLAALPANSVGSSQITDLSVGTAELADGAVTSAKIADGTIVAGDLANGAVTNAKLASDTARLNLLTNGGMRIWQRGTSFSFTGPASGYGPDKWLVTPNGTSVANVSQTAVGGDGNIMCQLAVTYNNGDVQLAQQIKPEIGGGWSQFKGRTISLTGYVVANVASAVRIALSSDGTGGAFTSSTIHPGGGTYQRLTVTYNVPNDATFVTIFGLYFSATATAAVQNLMLVVGSVPADYAPLHPADELARCLRYYENVGSPGGGDFIIRGYTGAGMGIDTTALYRVLKAATPTLTKTGTWVGANASQPAVAGASNLGFRTSITATAANQDTYMLNTAVNTGFISEANP